MGMKILAAVLALAPLPAVAAELITNGNFEAGGGSLLGWTASGETRAIAGVAYVENAFGSGSAAAQANTFASFGSGNVAGTETLAQSIATVAGRSYTLTFDYGAFGGNQPVELFVGGQSVGSYAGSGTANLDGIFTGASYSFVGTGALTEIRFNVMAMADDNKDAVIDNVSITAVPEPAAWALMIGGFGLVGAASRRRRAGSVTA